MEARRQRLVQRRGWDRAATAYEGGWREQLEPAHSALLDAAHLAAGEEVIDVACGTGLVTFAAARAVGPEGRVVATDLSATMVALTAAGAAAAGIDNVTTACCGAEDLTVPGPFDVAVCALGLMYVPDPVCALSEMCRVLRPSGRVAVAVWGERRNCGWAGLFAVVDERVSSDVCPMFFALGAPSVLASALTRAGFADVVERRIAVTLDYPGDDEALDAAFVAGPVALASGRFDAATRASAHRDYLDSIAPFRTADGGYRIPGEFVIATAIRSL